jgi:hypothetical protein
MLPQATRVAKGELHLSQIQGALPLRQFYEAAADISVNS